MLLYKDVLSGDEMVSDAFNIKLVDDVLYEVDCKMISMKAGAGDVDIGANASAEGEDADDGPADEGMVTVNNVAFAMRLQSTQFDKKSYMVYIKDYMKSVGKYLEENAPDRVEPFKKNIQPFIKKVLENFKDWEFYTGENMIPEGMVALLNYREDGVTPFFVFFRDGLKEEKL